MPASRTCCQTQVRGACQVKANLIKKSFSRKSKQCCCSLRCGTGADGHTAVLDRSSGARRVLQFFASFGRTMQCSEDDYTRERCARGNARNICTRLCTAPFVLRLGFTKWVRIISGNTTRIDLIKLVHPIALHSASSDVRACILDWPVLF